MDKLLRDFEVYLNSVLGVSVHPELWRASRDFPFYLSQSYSFYQLTMLGTPCLLMAGPHEAEITPEVLRKQMAQVRKYWDGEIICIASAISAYARKTMIAHKVPFVVPWNQMYLPSFAVDLREQFHTHRQVSDFLSPSTQSVVLDGLCFGTRESYLPSALAAKLGYSSMTMSRAFDELEAAGLAEMENRGKERHLHFIGDKAAIWEKAHEIMRNPVRKHIRCRQPMVDTPSVQAGLTALAHYTMLAAPDQPVYALSSAEWKFVSAARQPVHTSDQEQSDYEMELWSYSPRLFARDQVADPFSLYLSLQHSTDERVISALTQLIEMAL
jgi:hypothetical protein